MNETEKEEDEFERKTRYQPHLESGKSKKLYLGTEGGIDA
jgi:hypothetical protein